MCFSTKACLTPMQFRRKALELGFETKQKVRLPLPSLPVSMSQAASSSGVGQVEGEAKAKAKASGQVQCEGYETVFSDEEDGATDKDYEFVNESDRSPESPMASPRFTPADYSRLAIVMQELGNFNRKLLAFTSEALPDDGAAGEPACPEEEGEDEEDREGQEAADDDRHTWPHS